LQSFFIIQKMISNPFVRFSLIVLTLSSIVGQVALQPAIAGKEEAIFEDNLNTSGGLGWGGPDLPYRRTVDIKDSLVDTKLGRVAADRHGINAGGLVELIFGPFTNPYPGRMAFISLWGSKLEGCFVEMIVQYAPPGSDVDLKDLTPTTLEMGIGSQLVELPAQSNLEPKLLKQDYTYSRVVGSVTQNYSSTWYMTRNVFTVDSGIANILSNAPNAEVRARLTMRSGQKMLIPIRKETVSSWKSAYSYNPACQSAESIAKQRQLSDQPLVGAFENYSGSAAQIEALDWLERKLDTKTFAQFGNQWRGLPLSTRGKPVRLVDAGKFYKKTRQQKAAVEWLQKKISEDVLKEFVQKWN
jgi:hypothetical protein